MRALGTLVQATGPAVLRALGVEAWTEHPVSASGPMEVGELAALRLRPETELSPELDAGRIWRAQETVVRLRTR